MFKSEGEMAIAIAQDRMFEINGWILKFDPLLEKGCGSPFVCRRPGTDDWFAIKVKWGEYASVKEVFHDLDAVRSCVVNYLLGKADITNEAVDEILGMSRNCFWIRGCVEKRILGFSPRKRLGVRVDDFQIEKQGDIYLADE